MNDDTFLSFDPGLKVSGVAIFVDGSLLDAALFKVKHLEDDDAARWRQMADVIRRTCGTYPLVYERMQVDGRTGKAQAASIMELSGVTGALAALMRADVTGYTPSEWCKNRPKGPNHAKILRALTDHEKGDLMRAEVLDFKGSVLKKERLLLSSLRPKIDSKKDLYSRAVDGKVGQAEHVLDAIGIGLYHLKRLR